MSLRNRLENLVANPRLVETGTDLDFATSLLDYYNKKGSLSSGRRPWLDKLEDKYDAAAWVDPLDTPVGKSIVEALANEALAPRDRGFIESLKGQYVRWGKLSDKQLSALQNVSVRYSDAGIASRNEWTTSYSSGDLRQRCEIAAAYYAANPPYYGELADKILSQEGFIPSERQYNKITQNKYALKVIEATLAEPKYPLNALVEGRASAGRRLQGKKAFVLKVNAAPVVNAAKGSKRYLVLPIGEAAPMLVEEREIKKVRKI
jgi:hypothetical protein